MTFTDIFVKKMVNIAVTDLQSITKLQRKKKKKTVYDTIVI